MLAVWALAAFAGMVAYEDVPLQDVISSADAAVVVRLGDPAMRHAEIPVPGSEEKSCGTYSYGVWRVTVDEVVRAPSRGPELSPGDVINVFPGNTPDRGGRGLHRRHLPRHAVHRVAAVGRMDWRENGIPTLHRTKENDKRDKHI